MKLKIIKSNDKYFIVINQLKLQNDKEIASVLKMTTSRYRKILVNKFHAKQTAYNNCYFYYKERAEEVKDWAESILLANKLI